MQRSEKEAGMQVSFEDPGQYWKADVKQEDYEGLLDLSDYMVAAVIA